MTLLGERKKPIDYPVDPSTFKLINLGLKSFVFDWEDVDALPPGTFLLFKETVDEGKPTGSTCMRRITYVEVLPQGEVVIRAIAKT